MTQHRVLATAAMALSLVGSVALQAQSSTDSATGPSSLAYKGVTLTPIGFFADEAVWRQRNENADIGSSYNAIPFSRTTNGQLSELRMSARQSRIGLLAEGKLSDTKLTGYWESDFLSSGTTSNSNESNSYTLRLRQFWGQAAFENGATVSAGQMWSLLATNKSGLSPRKEAIPMTIDAQYVPGFDWARQAELRLTTKLGDKAWFGVSAEESNITLTQHGGHANFVVTQLGGNLLNGFNGQYSSDLAPDVVAKLAFEPGFGHYELKFLGRVMRDRMYSPGTTAGTYDSVGHNSSIVYAGGVGAAALWSLGKTADFGFSGLVGRGIGRYGTSQLADATVDSTGKLVPIYAAHALASLEVHATPKLDVYVYGGAEYEARTASAGVGYGATTFNNAGCNVEIAPTTVGTVGSPTGCTGDTRALYQGTVGYWYRFYKGPAGVMQWGLQYSYTGREAWSGVGGGPKATDGMGFTSIRYYIP